ncbi:MAG: ATP-binding protein [Thermoanaerobaculales bacterium]|nr:ATP-binding protein [Thermoanaerobaculales bacterium]
MMDKNRFLGSKIRKLMTFFPAVAVIGARQCGKSTLVQGLYPEWKYYDLERPDDYRLITSDPLGFFSRQSEKTIIDEAQQFPEIFSVLRGIIDRDRSATGRFLLTGSSSPDIVKGMSESLAGRIATVELSTFKAAEFYERPFPDVYERLTDRQTTIENLTDCRQKLELQQMYDHWLGGGYPEPRIKGKQEPAFHGLWMDAYFNDYVSRDIRRLFPRMQTHSFRLLIQSLSFQSGTIINRSTLARALEISSVTVQEYLEILHSTFLWRTLRSYERNPLKKVQKMPRGFFRDSGLLHHLLKLTDVDTLLVHPSAGASFESFVIEEIIRGFQCTMQSGVDFHYYRTKDRSEIDLIVEGPFGLIPIEVKLGHSMRKGMLKALRTFLKDTGAAYGIVVNNSDKIEMLADNIIQIPAIYF